MANWVAIVDDDLTNLKIASRILSKNNLKVSSFSSGKALLDFMETEKPDLILLDINMPEMDGFETYKRIRELEAEQQREETPVIFLTADEAIDSEVQSFSIGVSDYIRKPFDPDVLITRIGNILNQHQQLMELKEEAARDKLTGLLNKGTATEKLMEGLAQSSGYLMMIDLDSFKLVNDIYGHEMGDKILVTFSDIIKDVFPESSIIGRMGGDEFTAFVPDFKDEKDIREASLRLTYDLLDEAKRLMGDNMNIPLGASLGVIYVPKPGMDYEEMLNYADKALYHVKQNGKHGYYIFNDDIEMEADASKDINLNTISMLLAERNITNSALRLNKDDFISVYRFVMRYIMRYHRNACKVMFTLHSNSKMSNATFAGLCEEFGNHISMILRKSDLMMQYKQNQFFVLLTDIREEAIAQVIGNVLRVWNENHDKEPDNKKISISYEVEFVESEQLEKGDGKQLWVVVVDDDILNLKIAGHALSKENMRVTALNSGHALLEFLEDKRPDLILLDINMPGMDGFETLEKLRGEEMEIAEIPVVFLTAEGDVDFEKKGLRLGAMDFIRKPFVPEVLGLRVKQIVQLIRLQRNLFQEVDNKTRENEKMFIHVVQALAGAIDAKDNYTNGHSGRVADYSREIARRYGYNTKEQGDIYIMGLLHDVGKIGVPDAVINKPGKLNETEFAYIKKHPVIGYQILSNIQESPRLAIAARHHHEKYGGGGYPDGLVGDDIPEEARIIAVADAYDAMTSNRSYRRVLEQEVVRKEIEDGKGTQFDPRFADIMLQMIDEDKEYKMREV